MTSLATGSLSIPKQKLEPWLGKIQYGSTVAALSAVTPQTFGEGEFFTFNIGEAEYVGEGAQKGASTVTPTVKTVKPFKFHKTLRFNEEVLWADEDRQLEVVDEILDLIQPSLSRALDFGVIHEINPTGGAKVTAMNGGLCDSPNSVEYVATDKPYVSLDAADALVMADGFVPRDVALDPLYAAKFASARGTNSEQKLYPALKLDTAVSEVEGHRASVSNTVGAVGVAAVASNILGVVGDFSSVRWGVQKALGLEVIKYGDPDGGGDLKRNNQIAVRAEVVYGWGIAELAAFAVVLDAA
ncbi:phage major capsid protein [Nocardioides carbamazepini]|uniref:phage major capsid protein n=1 Tax=Nocardioides carbamazepini TaxID=2854259 RepID=UPI002149A1DD|nr:phage major capsid protein [Nocardioides carbamazepini]MCR1785309.1 phage major capsid protein [Nocardioides carbamazepini]